MTNTIIKMHEFHIQILWRETALQKQLIGFTHSSISSQNYMKIL